MNEIKYYCYNTDIIMQSNSMIYFKIIFFPSAFSISFSTNKFNFFPLFPRGYKYFAVKYVQMNGL